MLHILRDAGVVWLQMTGGEPLIDKLFTQTYAYAWDLAMMISSSTNAPGFPPCCTGLPVPARPAWWRPPRFAVQVKVGTDYELAHALKIDPRAIRAAQDLACSASPVQISFGRDASNRPNTGAASGVTSAVSPVRLNIRWIVRSSGAHPDCARKIRWTSAAVRAGLTSV